MASKNVMKCHYEVLNVPRDANIDDFKKAYRKLALKWHPDKNPDDVEECTRQFRIIQQAYDVLSDPQERAWYDKHREAILRGGLGHGDKYEDDSLDVFQYFNTSCFSGYNDEEKGFYKVYGEIFSAIAREDYEFMDDEDSDFEIPVFGLSESSYEEIVKPFYDYWEHYMTAKSYVWVEKYDIREAPDRRVRRVMEAENKKLRDAAKKERNEEIKMLVKFVKKRDKRVQAYKKKLEERNEEIARKAKEKREQHILERMKKLENYEETGWSAMTELEDDLQKLEAHLDDQFGDNSNTEECEDQENEMEEEDDYFDELFCVACNKSFKSDKAFANHEKSKKHKENVVLLRQQMAEDDEDFGTGDVDYNGENLQEGSGNDVQEEPESKQKLSKKQKKKRKQQKNQNEEDGDGEVDNLKENIASVSLNNDDNGPAKQSGKSRKARRKEKEKKQQEEDRQLDDAQESQKSEKVEIDDKIDVDSQVTDKVAGEDVDSRVTDSIDGEEPVSQVTDSVDGEDPVSQVNDSVAGGDTQCEEKTEKISGNENVRSANKKTDSGKQEVYKCNVCQQNFPTRNKMFTHIKDFGHALRVENSQQPVIENSKGKKNKKKAKK